MSLGLDGELPVSEDQASGMCMDLIINNRQGYNKLRPQTPTLNSVLKSHSN